MKAFLIDTSRCTGCRACQVACKQWNELPAEKTTNVGSYQNPPDLSSKTWSLVRFSEHYENGKMRWLFFKDQCRHCVEPPCMEADESGAVTRDDDTGAVIFKNVRVKNFEDIMDACPYNIPRQDKKTGAMAKCTMCLDRVKAGMEPACVKTCPTGAMNFGERAEMLRLGDERLKMAKVKFPKARLVDADEVAVIYLLTEPAPNYGIAKLESKGPVMASVGKLFRPFGVLTAGAALVGMVLGHSRKEDEDA